MTGGMTSHLLCMCRKLSTTICTLIIVGLAVCVKPRAAFAAALSFLGCAHQVVKGRKVSKALSPHLAFNKECGGGIMLRDRHAPCLSLPTKPAHKESQCFSFEREQCCL